MSKKKKNADACVRRALCVPTRARPFLSDVAAAAV